MNDKNKGSFESDAAKLGGSQLVMVAAAILIAIFVNLIADKLPNKVTKFDLSSAGYFTLSEQSMEIISSMTEPVTLYLIAETGNESGQITSLLSRYEEAGDMITVEYIDPVLYPTFYQKYQTSAPAENSVIVESARRSRVVDNSAIYVVDYSNYYTTGQTSMTFDGEGAITSALSYVATDDLPVVYTLDGHGESPLSANITSMITKDNYTISSLSLLTSQTVPEDCDALIVVSPRQDLTDSERDIILDYLSKGGSLLYFAGVTSGELPNFDALLAAYGLRLERGMIFEQGSSNYLAAGYFQYLLPNLSSHDITASMLEANQHVLMPTAQGVAETDSHRGTLDIRSILTTTGQSYLKRLDHDITTAEKETGDVDGPFSVGTVVTEDVPGGTTHLAIYTSALMLDDTIDSAVYSGNSNLVLSTLGWMCQHEQSMAIHAKPVDAEKLMIPGNAYNIISAVIVLALPVAILAVGAYVTISRRRK